MTKKQKEKIIKQARIDERTYLFKLALLWGSTRHNVKLKQLREYVEGFEEDVRNGDEYTTTTFEFLAGMDEDVFPLIGL